MKRECTRRAPKKQCTTSCFCAKRCDFSWLLPFLGGILSVYFFSYFFMVTGIIKTKTEKGFGFIKVEGSADVFFHNSACNGQYDSLNVGQTVSFDLVQGDKGPKAENVVAAEGAMAASGMDDSMAA